MQGDCGRVTTGVEKRRHDAVLTKGAVERAVGIVTNDHKIAGEREDRKGAARNDDLAIRLDHQRRGHCCETRKIGPHFASTAKGGIERAIWVVAGHRKILIRIVILFVGCPDDHQLAIRLNGHCVRPIGAMVKIGHHLAAEPECRVEISISRLHCLRIGKKSQHTGRRPDAAAKDRELVEF